MTGALDPKVEFNPPDRIVFDDESEVTMSATVSNRLAFGSYEGKISIRPVIRPVPE